MEATKPQLRESDWPKLSLVAAATLALYAPVLAKLAQDWLHNPNYSQGFLIPPLVAYLVWDKRNVLAATPAEPSNWGFALAIAAAALLFLGTLGAELFLTRISLILMLAAVVVFLFGWDWMRKLAFPFAVLLLMVPIPEIIFNQIAFPLQLIATRLAGAFLSAVGVPVYLEGNLIELPHNVTLEIAEACSGIRSLMALFALGVTYGYFFDRRPAMRWIIILATLPIAVIANAIRIAGTGVLTYLVSREAAEGYLHVFSGWLVFVLAFLMFVALHKFLSLFWRAPEPEAAR